MVICQIPFFGFSVGNHKGILSIIQCKYSAHLSVVKMDVGVQTVIHSVVFTVRYKCKEIGGKDHCYKLLQQ